MPPWPRYKFTDEALKEIASKYRTRLDFKKGNNAAYQACLKRNIDDDICAHMRTRGNLYPDDILAEALKYNRRIDFYRGSPGAYQAARRRKILDEVCKHMES